MLYLGSLLHEDVKTVAYFKHIGDFCKFFTFNENIYDLRGSIVFFFNGQDRLGSELLKYDSLSEAKGKACVYNLKK
jgi:hypothetical protein